MTVESVLKILEQATNENMYEWDNGKPDSMHLGRSRSEWEAYWRSSLVYNWFVVGYDRCPSGCCKIPQTHPDARLKIVLAKVSEI